jgi:hypothetical protein
MQNISLRIVLDAPLGLRHGDDAKGFFLRTSNGLLPQGLVDRMEGKLNLMTSTLRFFAYGSKGGFGVVSVGEESTSMLHSICLSLFARWQEETGVSPSVQVDPINVETSDLPYFSNFLCHGVCVDNGAAWRAAAYRFREGSIGMDELRKRAEEVVRNGISRQCEFLFIDFPEDGLMGEFEVTNPRIARHSSGKAFLRVDVSFKSNLRFTGHWGVGMCSSKGWGRIRSVRAAVSKQHCDLAVAGGVQ